MTSLAPGPKPGDKNTNAITSYAAQSFQVAPGPTKGYCEGNREACSICRFGILPALFGTLLKPSRDGKRRVKGCGDPVARGKRNRASGLKKQRTARNRLGVQSRKFSDANEETWVDNTFANEVKSGKQCGPLVNWWRKVEAQVLANEAEHGDRRRPVRAVAMPEGWGKEGIVAVRLSTWDELVRPALEEFYGSDT